MKRRVYCLAVRESLSPVGSLESFRATFTKNLSNDCCFWENRLNCEYVTLSRQTSSTRIAKHRLFIKLKFLQSFCSSCKTLADQVARNPRFYCTWIHLFPCTYFSIFLPLLVCGILGGPTDWGTLNWVTGFWCARMCPHVCWLLAGTVLCSVMRLALPFVLCSLCAAGLWHSCPSVLSSLHHLTLCRVYERMHCQGTMLRRTKTNISTVL
jgi:hypothetical protein